MEKYENLGLIGEGSYGMVWKCRNKVRIAEIISNYSHIPAGERADGGGQEVS